MSLGPDVSHLGPGISWVSGAQEPSPVLLRICNPYAKLYIQSYNSKSSVFFLPLSAKSQNSWLLAIFFLSSLECGFQCQLPFTPSFFRLRSPDPSTPLSNSGVQSLGLLPQTGRSPFSDQRPESPAFLSTPMHSFTRTYAGSFTLVWTKWMKRDTTWKQKSPRTSLRWEAWGSLSTFTVDRDVQDCSFRLRAMSVCTLDNSKQKAGSGKGSCSHRETTRAR